MIDILIKNGTIIDGTGRQRYVGDIGIQHGLICDIGNITNSAKQTIDAHNKLVTPGWVDIHTHYDGQVTWDSLLTPSSWHGVTTVMMGNCGVGFAPVKPSDRSFLIALMEGVEDIPGTALIEGINWKWKTFPEYLDFLESRSYTIDIATHVPHAPIRAYVMGERCNREYSPTQKEIDEMSSLVKEGVEAGAFGFSTSRTLLHKDIIGRHVPGTFSCYEEMLAISSSMKGCENAVLEMASDNLGEDEEWAWINEFQNITGLSVNCVATSAAAHKNNKLFDSIEQAKEKGYNIKYQIGPRPTGIIHGLQSGFHVFVGHPTWIKHLKNLEHAELVRELKKPHIQQQLLSEQSTAITNIKHILNQTFRLNYDKPLYEPSEEERIGDIKEMLHLLIENDGKDFFYQPIGGYENYSFAKLKELLEHPDILFGLSDAGAHCGIISDSSMPTFVMTHWGRDRLYRSDRLSLEYIVQSMTSKTAEMYGMNDRGKIQVGLLADLNIIDFKELRLFGVEAVHDLPAGGRRLIQRSAGYEYTIKSGVITFRNGIHSGQLPGQLIRRKNS